MMLAPFDVVVRPDSIEVAVVVRPNGRRSAIEGVHDRALVVRVVAAPEKGKANRAVEATLADAFEVRESAVRIVAGSTGRRKRVAIDGRPSELLAQLRALTGSDG